MTSYFDGDERLEISPLLNRSMRMGSPAQIYVPDHQRVIEAIQSGDIELSLDYINLFHTEYKAMLSLLIEWNLQIPQTFKELSSSETERRITESNYTLFLEAISSINYSSEVINGRDMHAEIVEPSTLTSRSAVDYRKQAAAGKTPTQIENILKGLNQRYESIIDLIGEHNLLGSIAAFNHHRDFALGVHDACVQFTQSYPQHVAEQINQKTSEALIQKSFSSCSFFEPLWAVGTFPKDALAAFLAEHLRFHFSGDESRGGSVEIVEDDEKYKLIFNACGSGGAMRRRLANTDKLKPLPQASEATWYESNAVPAYCAHCAFNEVTSIEKFGYPILVTEFNEDPYHPCGWTIYKEARFIPDEYFTRIGRAKP